MFTNTQSYTHISLTVSLVIELEL